MSWNNTVTSPMDFKLSDYSRIEIYKLWKLSFHDKGNYPLDLSDMSTVRHKKVIPYHSLWSCSPSGCPGVGFFQPHDFFRLLCKSSVFTFFGRLIFVVYVSVTCVNFGAVYLARFLCGFLLALHGPALFSSRCVVAQSPFLRDSMNISSFHDLCVVRSFR